GLALRPLRENWLRTILTVVAVAISVLAFITMRTFVWSWTVAAEVASEDRIVSRNKVTFFMPIPKRYSEDVRAVDGVRATTFAIWSDGKTPQNEQEYFPALGVDTRTFLTVFDEMSVPEERKLAWFENRQGAVVGQVLASKMGWKVGDRVRLVSGKFPKPGEWEFEIEGIYRSTKKSLEQTWFIFHYDFFNSTLPEEQRDTVNWITSRISDGAQAASISKTIDGIFDTRDVQTVTMSQRAAIRSFLGMVSAILSAVNVISIAILVIMMLLVGNTIAMAVRSRTNQYAVLRAIGFERHHILFTVLTEGLALGALGGTLGLLLAYPFVNQGLGRFIEENMGSYFPYFRVTPEVAVLAFALALLLGGVAAALPARAASRLNVLEALRKVG
ncbi:MAG: ABC transporter permease, partial [Myxococcota bacterium]